MPNTKEKILELSRQLRYCAVDDDCINCERCRSGFRAMIIRKKLVSITATIRHLIQICGGLECAIGMIRTGFKLDLCRLPFK